MDTKRKQDRMWARAAWEPLRQAALSLWAVISVSVRLFVSREEIALREDVVCC